MTYCSSANGYVDSKYIIEYQINIGNWTDLEE